MSIINVLNTTQLDKSNATNNVNPKKLTQLLNSRLNNKFKQSTYLGEGINGALYKLWEAGPNAKEYICKLIPYDPQLKEQFEKELGLLKSIEQNPYMDEYVNPCVASLFEKNYMISIFPVFRGITLDNALKVIMKPDFNHENRILLLKYIVKSILEAVFFFHRQEVCHLQINRDSILVELEPPKASNLAKNKVRVDKYSNIDNEDIPISKKDLFVPDNTDIYSPIFKDEDKPLQIKFTNFGTGCGKLSQLNNASQFATCRVITYEGDPYLKRILTPSNLSKINGSQKIQLKISKKYDIWLTGKLLESMLMPEGNIIDPKFDLYMKYINKYMLCPLKNRENTKFVLEMILLGEKHD